MWNRKNRCCLFLCLLVFIPFSLCAAEDNPPTETQNGGSMNNPGIFLSGVGGGFRPGTKVVGLSLGLSDAWTRLGGEGTRHVLALFSVSYGRMIGKVKGMDHWYQGNWELRGELFGGIQYDPETRSLLGVAPHLRYHFATGTRLIPYVDVGAGVSLTDIGEPDIGGPFEFNLQAIAGVNYFLRDNLGINISLQYLHISSAGIYKSNHGINGLGCFLGFQKFF